METYEEQNPTAATPNNIPIGGYGEFDFPVENYGAGGDTTYYFRVVRSDGTALEAYTRYAQLATQAPAVTQSGFRFYQNVDAVQPATAWAGENAEATGVALNDVLRLRLKAGVATAPLAAGKAFKLQFATSTSGPWTDVGGVGSGGVWRGYDNATPADGAAVESTLLAGASDAGTYEEANASAGLPSQAGVGAVVEWDWVLQDNGASGATTYYFRKAYSDGAVFGAYTAYPSLVTATSPSDPVLTLAQFRWYANVDDSQPSTPLAAQNVAVSQATEATVFRLRVNIGVTNQSLSTGAAFKLQFSTSVSGPWTDVGNLNAGTTWRGYDNPGASDGVTVPSTVLGLSGVKATYEETNPSAGTPFIVGTGAYGEWDWALKANNPIGGTTFYFRVVRGNGVALDTYNVYPAITMAAGLLDQAAYRFYTNADSLAPGAALADQNTAIAGSASGARVRLRVALEASTASVAAGQTLKLQYGTSPSGPWTDVSGVAGTTPWRAYNNASVADGVSLESALLTGSSVVQTYEEANNTSPTPNVIQVGVGSRSEWDWVLHNNDAISATTYYFRMVYSNGAVLNAYSAYPQVTVATATVAQSAFRVYTNADALAPGDALAAQDTGPTMVASGTVVRLRIGLTAASSAINLGAQYKLQFATNTGGPWTDVGGLAAATPWRGYDNPATGDGWTLSGVLLSTSSTAGSYEETNPSLTAGSLLRPGAANGMEWDWALQQNGATSNTVYYFRMVYNAGTALDVYSVYGQIRTNALPDAPGSLGPADHVDSAGVWSTDSSPQLTFVLADQDAGQQVRYRVQIASDSAFTSLTVDYTSPLQAQGAAAFEIGQAGTYTVGSEGMTLPDLGTGYWWRVRGVDATSEVSVYSDSGVAATADFKLDATAPALGSLNDGTADDEAYNDGSLTGLDANWSGFSDATSGIVKYEYSIGTEPGGTQVKAWTDVGLNTSVSAAGLILRTGQAYHFNLRATDAAGNITSVVSSDGTLVAPTLSFTVSETEIDFGSFTTVNSAALEYDITVTVSTNAYNGYTIRVWTPGPISTPDSEIPDFVSDYQAPQTWSTGAGFGYNTDDCSVNFGLFWTGANCTGSRQYAAFSHATPGDVVRQHVVNVTGATGPVVNETTTLRLRLATQDLQRAGSYSVPIRIVVVPSY